MTFVSNLDKKNRISTNQRAVCKPSRWLLTMYIIGSGIWLAFNAASSQTFPFARLDGSTTIFGVAQALFFALAFFAIGYWDGFRRPFRRYALAGVSAAGFALGMLLAAIGVIVGADVLLLCATVALALGKSCGFFQWLRMLATFELKTAKSVLLLGSAIQIALTFLLSSVGSEVARGILVFLVFAPLGTMLMLLCVKEMPAPIDEGMRPSPRSSNARSMFQEMALPTVCAFAIVLITPIASSAFSPICTNSISAEILVPLSHSVALGIMASLWFGFPSHRSEESAGNSVTLPAMYGVFLPVLASLVIALILTGASSYSWLVIALGNAGYFFVSLLMVVTSLEVARHYSMSPLAPYGLIAGCVYLSDLLFLVLREQTDSGAINPEPYVVALLLLYVLMIPVFFFVAPHLRSAEKDPGGTDEQPRLTVCPPDEDPFSQIEKEYGLTARQSQVMRLLATGRDVNHIAAETGLAPNTVRSYRKSLYAALSVHGLQELLDLVDSYSSAAR